MAISTRSTRARRQVDTSPGEVKVASKMTKAKAPKAKVQPVKELPAEPAPAEPAANDVAPVESNGIKETSTEQDSCGLQPNTSLSVG